MSASEIPVDSISHLNFAFGYITPDYRIQAMDGVPENLLSQITSLKAKNPSLLVSIALGGWTFTDPGTYRNVFTDMVSSAASRQTFITNLLGFLVLFHKS
jgi:chitinase